jgi:hypothetical protein
MSSFRCRAFRCRGKTCFVCAYLVVDGDLHEAVYLVLGFYRGVAAPGCCDPTMRGHGPW